MNPVAPQSDRLAFSRALIQRGQLGEAAKALEELLLQNPNHLEAQFIRGMIACQTKDWQAGIKYLQAVAALQPNRFEAVYGLAVCNKNAGAYGKAIDLIQQALTLMPRHPAALNELGVCQTNMKDPVAALRSFNQALEHSPRSAEIHHNRGLALAALGRSFDARDAFRQAVSLSPGLVESQVQLAMQFERLGDWRDCMESIDSALKHCREDATLLGILGRCHSELGDLREAEKVYRHGFDRFPSLGGRYAQWLQEEGRFADSIAVLWNSLDRYPVQGAAYYGLAEAKMLERDGKPLSESAIKVLDSSDLEEKERIFLLFALARFEEANGKFEAAMEFFDKANEAGYRCFNEGRPYDRAFLRSITDRTIERYAADFFSTGTPAGILGPTPLLIVGMIRAGTTLLDQILSSHPMISSAGEQVFWTVQTLLREAKGDPSLTNEAKLKLRHEYIGLLESRVDDAPNIIDKMPLNYAFLGLILDVCPNAKVVHIRRNPVDTCLSIYTNHFGLGPNFAYNRSNIVFNYREYQRLMEHWRSAIPSGSFFELEYEELVKDREPQIRRLLEFLGLPWDDACLRHTSNRSPIRTPSKWQARQGIYRTSVDRWKHYEPWLGEFQELIAAP